MEKYYLTSNLFIENGKILPTEDKTKAQKWINGPESTWGGLAYQKFNYLKTQLGEACDECYDYFKKEVRNLRKMGHYIILE